MGCIMKFWKNKTTKSVSLHLHPLLFQWHHRGERWLFWFNGVECNCSWILAKSEEQFMTVSFYPDTEHSVRESDYHLYPSVCIYVCITLYWIKLAEELLTYGFKTSQLWIIYCHYLNEIVRVHGRKKTCICYMFYSIMCLWLSVILLFSSLKIPTPSSTVCSIETPSPELTTNVRCTVFTWHTHIHTYSFCL